MKRIINYIVFFISIMCFQESYAVVGKDDRLTVRAVGVLCATDHGGIIIYSNGSGGFGDIK